jgi:pyruvate dehydrogenase E1 component beta subunit
VFLEQKLLYRTKGPVPEEDYSIPLGKADVKRQGKDLTVISYGRMIPRCLKVAEDMAKTKGVDVEVVDLRSLVPLDKETLIASVKKTGKCLVVYEAPQTGGFGGEVVSVIADSDAFFYLDAPIRRLGGLDVPIPYNPNLEALVVPTEDKIAAAIESLL